MKINNKPILVSCKFLRGLAWYYPFYKGRGRFALAGLEAESPNTLTRVDNRYGQRIFAYTKDYIGQMIILFGDLDPTASIFILANVSVGDQLIDVGANIGVISLPAAKKVGQTGKVLAIEPNEKCTYALALSKSENKLQNIQIIESALMSFNGRAGIDIPPTSFGQSRVLVGATESSQQCDVRTLDSLVSELARPRIRLLKIDVEGSENEVLLGGAGLLASKSIDIIVFESHPREGSFESREEVLTLMAFGYNIYEIKKGVMLSMNLARVVPGCAPVGSEFVAVREDLEVDIKKGAVSR